MNENKEILTIENFKKRNSSFRLVLWLTIPGCLIFIVAGIIATMDMFKSGLSGPAFITPIMFILLPLAGIFFFLYWMKKEKKENKIIDNGNFKIVEDRIYDKHMYTTRDSDGDTHYHYLIFSKIYGKISVGTWEYNCAQKDDSIYLLFYSDNEQNNNYENITEEEKRNRKIIDQEYLASKYELSPELTPHFVPYDETLGKANYTKRIEEEIKEKEERKGKVICKNCGTKYNLKKEDVCPECNSIYHFDITDAMHEKEWY